MKTAFILIVIIIMTMAAADAQVSGKGFNMVLKTLLSHQVPEISVADAHKVRETALFLDAREPAEFAVSHLPGARFVGYKKFDMATLKDVSKNRLMIVYCAVGKRSENITEQLMKAGFTDIYNLYGGIFEWVNAGYGVVDQADKPTEKVHAYSHLWGRFLQHGEKVY